MATNYSLLVWGGKNGYGPSTSPACTCSGATFTLTAHGMSSYDAGRPDSSKVQFVGGTLPGNAALATDYYVKKLTDNTFELYTNADLTTGKLTTSSAGSGWVLKSSYYVGLSSVTRWTNGGTEDVYGSLPALNTARAAATGAYDIEEVEVANAFVDKISAALTINMTNLAVAIRPKVNGVYSDAYHAGTRLAGYVLNSALTFASTLTLSGQFTTFEDMNVQTTGGSSSSGVSVGGNICTFQRNFVAGASTSSGVGINVGGKGCYVFNNVVSGYGNGIAGVAYATDVSTIANNTVAKCGTGFPGGSNVRGWWYNNISVGCTTANWGATAPSQAHGFGFNAGVSGDSPWGANSISTLTTDSSTFVDYTNNDFRLTATATAIDAGTVVATMPSPVDIAGLTRPNYNNGGAEGIDIGAREYDHGYGEAPTTVPISLTSLAADTRIKIAKQSDGTELYNDVPGTSYSDDWIVNGDIPVYVYARKSSATPYYHPLKIAATVDADSGLSISFAGLQNEDIAAHDYTGTAVATDWSFNLSTGAITHDSGTTRYSVQDLYSWHQDYTDGSTQVDDDPLMHGTTPTIFELINNGYISDADMQDLYGGSVEFPNGDLWTNLWTTDTMAAAHSVYVVQDGSKYTAFWGSGAIDVLLQVSDAGTLRDSGLVDVYAREYGYTYAYYRADLSAGGRVVAPLATLEDATTQSISSATAAGYTDVGYTFGSTSQDLGEGGGAGTYYCRIDCAGRTLDQVFARTMYDTRDVSTTTLNSAAGWKYRKAHSSYVANDAAPFGNYSGGFWNVAQGVWLDNVASADQYNYKLTDHAGTTHQLTLPAGAATATVLDGSRVVLYNTTQATEIDNVLMSGSTAYSYTITTEANTNDVLTLFVFKEGYEEASANMIWSGTTQSFVISQETHPYIAALRTELSITDYTTITEFAPDTTGHVYIESDDVDGNSQKARAAIWYNGILTTEGGARYFRGGMTILSTAAFRINVDAVDMLFENVNPTTPLVFTDLTRRLYRSDGTSIIAPGSYSIHNDYNGVPDVVETGVSGLTGLESAKLMDVPSAAANAAATRTELSTELARISDLAKRGGVVSGTPVVIPPGDGSIVAGDVEIDVSTSEDGTVTLARV